MAHSLDLQCMCSRNDAFWTAQDSSAHTTAETMASLSVSFFRENVGEKSCFFMVVSSSKIFIATTMARDMYLNNVFFVGENAEGRKEHPKGDVVFKRFDSFSRIKCPMHVWKKV